MVEFSSTNWEVGMKRICIRRNEDMGYYLSYPRTDLTFPCEQVHKSLLEYIGSECAHHIHPIWTGLEHSSVFEMRVSLIIGSIRDANTNT